MTEIVLTVPHAACQSTPNRFDHPCDLTAVRAAQALARALPETKVFTGDLPRTVCDLNRVECRTESLFRRILTAYLAGNHDRILALLDIHSYPPWTRDWTNYEIILLVESAGHSPWIYRVIRDGLRARGISVGVLQGVSNDIQHEAWLKHGVPALLIEFNESLSQERIEAVAQAVAMSLYKPSV